MLLERGLRLNDLPAWRRGGDTRRSDLTQPNQRCFCGNRRAHKTVKLPQTKEKSVVAMESIQTDVFPSLIFINHLLTESTMRTNQYSGAGLVPGVT